MKKMWLGLVLCLVASVMVGCGGSSAVREMVDPNSPAQRSVARWEAMINGNYAAAYQYYTPGYRSANTLSSFISRYQNTKLSWDRVAPYDHQCEAERCTVRVNLTYTLVQPLPGVETATNTSLQSENWIKLDDVWYYVAK